MTTPVTIVTGARKGIGRYLAEHYVQLGHLVFGCSRQPAGWSAENFRHTQLDVSDEAAVVRWMGQIRRAVSHIDNLINNAGIASMNHCLTTPAPTVARVLATNVTGTFLMSREAAKLMKGRGRGRIVNFTTVAAPLKLEGEAIYAASKDAVRSLTHILAHELSPLRITVNAIGPTPIDTDLIRTVPKHKLESLLARQAVKRYGELDDVANVIDFFISPRSDFITGQCIYLGGI